MSDEFRPREHDHLVEPMFAGLGVEGRQSDEAPAQPRRGLLARCLAFLRRVFGRWCS